ncbi:hypothetical protein E4U21_001634 [Claviceps maximensis]|nr:hypothetical protein E4U21_001634 [Claviceps maximensis]
MQDKQIWAEGLDDVRDTSAESSSDSRQPSGALAPAQSVVASPGLSRQERQERPSQPQPEPRSTAFVPVVWCVKKQERQSVVPLVRPDSGGSTCSLGTVMTTTKSPAQQAPPLTQNNTGRIKYADPRSLPSFPSSGLASDGAAAGAAASLGWSNRKSVDIWKPDPSSSASAAAVLAKDYKPAPQWQPSAQSDGHRAALLAVGSAGAALKRSNTPSVSPGFSQNTWGNSAANQAFHAARPPSDRPSNLANGGHAANQAFNLNRSQSVRKAETRKTSSGDKATKALMAAKGAMRRPASVIGLKDIQASEARAAASALNGATLAHRQSMTAKPGLGDVGAVSVTTMTRNMFTANPPVKPEVDERTYNERIHQSAVEMAKTMYARQQIMVEQTKGAQATAESSQPNQYVNLQEAAYKQAQARLAKLHDEHQQSRDIQEYYGNEKSKLSPKSRNSMLSMLRRRGSDSDDSIDDRQQSQKIREQMSMFSSKLSQVDKEKREKDREALLVAAQRNVKARLHGMDQKVYNETGRVNPSLITDWEVKAQKAAQTSHDSRTENKGKVDMGGGMFMTQQEIDAIASKRIQPVLDDINNKTEAERERQEVLKLEEQARREEAEKQKSRDREAKEIVKKTKEQEKQEEKAKKTQEKLEGKKRRDEEKAAKAEEKRLAKEEKRRSKLSSVANAPSASQHEEQEEEKNDDDDDDDVVVVDETGPARNGDTSGAGLCVTTAMPIAERSTVETHIYASGSSQHKGEGSPTSPTAKVKSWIKHTFSREKSSGEQNNKRRSFFGGATMKNKDTNINNGSVVSIGHRSSSMHDVALVGQAGDEEALGNDRARPESDAENKSAYQGEDGLDSHGVSPVSTPLEEERELGSQVQAADEARVSRKSSMEPPPRIKDDATRVSSSPNRDSRFREELK